uniref:DNA mismatch repair protein MutL n=1 Tax=Bursaphelenchus xylophilus TaxID=6326 RepID=A0A1I7SFC3_BURXY
MAESADGAVRKLRSDVARQISTGQVIVSLMGACRELIDNALDAGASTVEVRLKEHGADALEVSDNGHGISSENFSSLGKPHATSKLTDFNDFNSLLTFGFRGEALNALCALGNVTITTRHKLAKLGTKLTFSPTGEIFSQTVATRPIGTTVCVEKLFHALPVRRKEFVKNAKREMHRLLGAVQAFALSRTDVRFTVSNGNGV